MHGVFILGIDILNATSQSTSNSPFMGHKHIIHPATIDTSLVSERDLSASKPVTQPPRADSPLAMSSTHPLTASSAPPQVTTEAPASLINPDVALALKLVTDENAQMKLEIDRLTRLLASTANLLSAKDSQSSLASHSSSTIPSVSFLVCFIGGCIDVYSFCLQTSR